VHLVGIYTLEYYYDARTHGHKTLKEIPDAVDSVVWASDDE
jgi:hypothetical protein